jgi:hypothetical protein
MLPLIPVSERTQGMCYEVLQYLSRLNKGTPSHALLPESVVDLTRRMEQVSLNPGSIPPHPQEVGTEPRRNPHRNTSRSQVSQSTMDPSTNSIPPWYLKPRSDDWADSGLSATASGSDDLQGDEGGPAMETWELTPDELKEFRDHEFLIVKESWLTEEHCKEFDMFHSVKGKFGVPNVLATTRPCLYRQRDPSKFWEVGETFSKHPESPDLRCLIRTIYTTQGRKIYELESPYHVLQAILHAMLGLYYDNWMCPSLIFPTLQDTGSYLKMAGCIAMSVPSISWPLIRRPWTLNQPHGASIWVNRD